MQTEFDSLLRRVEDLRSRCDRAGILTATQFLTPAEQAAVDRRCKSSPGPLPCFFGGDDHCERRAAFFLPDWMEPGDPALGEAIALLRIDAYYGTPGHRDYLGALLAQGVRREWIGDIRILGQTAWVFCLPTVAGQLAGLTQAGRISVRVSEQPLSAVPPPVVQRRAVRFTVQSPRFDAILGETFRLSRTAAGKLIAAGAASLNYLACEKNDAPVSEGDVISLRGYGKAEIREIGGESRKGRLFVRAEIFA